MRPFLSTLFSITAALAFLLFQRAVAQNTSPYWSLVGNSNATTSSKLGTTNAVSLRFFANNVQRMLVGYSSGNVSIGATTLDARLTVNAATGSNIFLGQANGTTKLRGASNGGFSIGSGSTPPTNGLYVAGNVGIGTSSPSNKLHVVGRGRFTDGLSVEQSGIYSNHSSGNGVEAYGETSSYGIGVYGSGYYGVYGRGTTYGVYGSGATYGLYGVGTTYGLYASGTSYGASTSGAYYGLLSYGTNSSSSIGVYGSGTAQGVYGYGSASATAGVYGYTPGGGSGAGVYGYNASYGYGVRGYGQYGAGIYGQSGSGYAGYFAGNIYVSGTYTSSDSKLKKDVSDLSSAMDIIGKLQPKSYTFRQDGNYKLMNLPEGQHFGLLAQDLEKVLPSLVKNSQFQTSLSEVALVPGDKNAAPTMPAAQKQENETIEFKAVNYMELIPIMVKGMQEQSALIENQQTQIDALKTELSRIKGGSVTTVTGIGTLGLSSPNPATQTARITYTLPAGSGRAQLLVTDNLGRTLKTVALNNSGYVNLDVRTLSSGVYNYSLIVDGKVLESKKLNVIR